MTNTAGAVQGTLTMTAFGQAVASSGSSTDPYEFAATSGYRNDGDAGLMLVGARYYDAQAGMFISRDTYLDQLPYAYCDGDPVNATDPSGHIPGWLKKLGKLLAKWMDDFGGGDPGIDTKQTDPTTTTTTTTTTEDSRYGDPRHWQYNHVVKHSKKVVVTGGTTTTHVGL